MSDKSQSAAEREAKVLAVGAAEFKVEEARFFLAKATAGSQNSREFRFYLDAVLDAIDAAKDIAQDLVGKDPVLSKVIGRRLQDFSRQPETKIVIKNRIAAHHRYRRAALRGVIEAGELVKSVSAHDHVEYAVVVRPGLPPKDQKLTWTLVDGSKHYDALALCEHVLAGVGSMIAGIRSGMGLQPDKGLKRLRMQILKEGPTIHRPVSKAEKGAPQAEPPGEGGKGR